MFYLQFAIIFSEIPLVAKNNRYIIKRNIGYISKTQNQINIFLGKVFLLEFTAVVTKYIDTLYISSSQLSTDLCKLKISTGVREVYKIK